MSKENVRRVGITAASAAYLNIPFELTGHSVGSFPFVIVVARGQQLTGGDSADPEKIRLKKLLEKGNKY